MFLFFKVNSRRHRSRHNKHHFRSNSRNINHARKLSKSGTKRESSTSLDSHLQLINALTSTGDLKNVAPNLNRRTGCAGLDGQHVSNLFTNGKLVIPYNRSNIKSGSEDENVSVTISESTFNMKVSNHANNNLDLNDQLVMKSLRQGPHIEELHSSSSEDIENHDKDYGQEKRSKSGRESHSSKRSKRSKQSRKNYSSNSESFEDKNSQSESSSCPEIKHLVQSSLNSGVSIGNEKNRSSRQSKRSIDVAVQANAHDIVEQMQAYDCDMISHKKSEEEKHKSKKTKTRENKKYRNANKKCKKSSCDNFEKVRTSKDKYKNCGTSEEMVSLFKQSSRKE